VTTTLAIITAVGLAAALGFLFYSIYIIGHSQGYIDALNEHAKPALEEWERSLALWEGDIKNFRQVVETWNPPSGGPGDD